MDSATERAKMNVMEEDATRKNSNHTEDSLLRNRRKSQIIHSMWEEAVVTVLGSAIVGLQDGTLGTSQYSWISSQWMVKKNTATG
jgi:hypothetical protein